MNEGGMKQRQRFMARWHKEYVWLSAVWWKQLDLSDGHMVRNLLNDSIPPEKLHEKGSSSLSMSSWPFLRHVCSWRWMKRLWQKPTKNHKPNLTYAYYATLLHVWHASLTVETLAQEGIFQPFWFVIAFRSDCVSPRLNQRFKRQKKMTVSISRQGWIISSADKRL